MSRGMRRVPTYYQDLFDIIAKDPGHVIGSTACLGGALPTQLLKYRDTQDEVLLQKIFCWIERMDSIFGHGDFYLEMQPSKNKDQIYVNNSIISLSEKFDIPYIITTDSHYLKKDDAKIHKAYLNSQDGDREVDSFYATTYMMGTEELESYFKYFSNEILQTAYNNIENITNKCEDYSLLKPLDIPKLKWKKHNAYDIKDFLQNAPWLNKFICSDFIGDRELAVAITEAIKKDSTLQNIETYKEINECLKMTWISSEKNKTHWSSYILNLENIVEECWKAGTIVGPGRGSGVGFILLYLLNITQINPLREKTKTFRWRFLNPDRVSVLDVDIDIEGGRRKDVLNHLREVYGEDRVANVATFGTEKAKSAILTACRGLGIDVDVAQYLSSMIVADRGLQRTLSQTFYGDEEAGFPKNKQFVHEMTENYPEVWEVAQKIEGLVCRLGEHAGGVIFVDEPFTKTTALMRAPNGDLMTQYDLHDCEDCSLIKYDLLSVEALDKMHICLDLLADYNYIKREDTLKETYEKVIGIYNLERDNKDMWKMTWNHEIQSLFQMEKQSGIQGIALTHPESVDDLATLNSVIRLMAQEKGAEQPLNKFARFKKDINLWYKEMDDYGLTPEEEKLLEPVVKLSYGICESQEGFMQLVQMPECGGFDLTWADKLRKSIAKKNPAAYEELQKEYFKTIKEKNLSESLCNYVWNVLVATSRGYGFNKSHTLAYSLIALQEMNLAFKFPIIFWNCACLISDSGGAESEEDDEEEYIEPVNHVQEFNDIEDFSEDIEDNEDDDEEAVTEKKKKKVKATNYGKIATAIGKIKNSGIKVTPPDINNSAFTFSPDIQNNTIRYGLSGITRIGDDLIKEIINNRPYESVTDFLNKNKVSKPQVINLIKCGAFDNFGDRIEIMKHYIDSISDKKKAINLRNLQMLINMELLPREQFDFEIRVFNYNKYLKTMKYNDFYYMDNIAFSFFEKHYDMDKLLPCNESESGFMIKKDVWDIYYKQAQNKIRPYVKAHEEELKNTVNNTLYQEMWNKYALGNLSQWEMDSVSFYSHSHELLNANLNNYNIDNFQDLSPQPEIERVIYIKNKQVPLFQIHRIAGTVLDKDKDKKIVTLLTTDGVVTVKIYGQVFSHYDRQISVKNPKTGKKKVIEKSWLSRGNKIIVTGIRREDSFIAKKYSKTPWHLVELITDVDADGEITTQQERVEV